MALQQGKELPDNLRFEMLLRGVVACDPDTGAFLMASNGRSHYAPRWFLIYSHNRELVEPWDWLPYRQWRTVFRAWSKDEAIQIANTKLKKLARRGKVHETGFLAELRGVS